MAIEDRADQRAPNRRFHLGVRGGAWLPAVGTRAIGHAARGRFLVGQVGDDEVLLVQIAAAALRNRRPTSNAQSLFIRVEWNTWRCLKRRPVRARMLSDHRRFTFAMDQELRGLLQVFYATRVAPRPHSRLHSLDPQIGPYRCIARC
jgi:hypothetical protein